MRRSILQSGLRVVLEETDCLVTVLFGNGPNPIRRQFPKRAWFVPATPRTEKGIRRFLRRHGLGPVLEIN